MPAPTCGACQFLKSDPKGQTACFAEPPVPDPTAARYGYRTEGGIRVATIADGVYPAVGSQTPACGKFLLRQPERTV